LGVRRLEGVDVMKYINTSSPKGHGVRFAIFYGSFSLIGLLLAFWYGLGWLILFQTLRRFLFVTPVFYIPIARFLVSPEFAKEEKVRTVDRGFRWVKSPISAIVTIFTILLTVLCFWKINIPLIDVIKMLIP
jgi:hypothetical protein